MTTIFELLKQAPVIYNGSMLASSDRFFSPDPATRNLAHELYEQVAALPILSPHGHVDARLFADPNYRFGSPADLFILPDHYIPRMLYSQGLPLEQLGIASRDGGEVEHDHRKIWKIFCGNFHLFSGTPSSLWLRHELGEVFGLDEKPSLGNADRLYDLISEKLALPEFTPRRLYERFNIEVLCTTDAATDTLEAHQAIRASGWQGRILPTFRPDALVNLDRPGLAGESQSPGRGQRDWHWQLFRLYTRPGTAPGILQGDGGGRHRPCRTDAVHG